MAAAAEAKDDEVPPTEDLMREHGILRRVLLIYGEALRRADAPTEPVHRGAEIVRAFIEDYHERDEEQYIFPRFEKAHKMVDLVTTLREQHQAGRKLTAAILQAKGKNLADPMRMFIRMYEPHAAREDTVLFPAFRTLVSAKELDHLKDVFEDKERALPGGGFEKMVAEVAQLEQAMGIGDLSRVTPHLA